MKQRHRAYASPSNVVRFVGSLVAAVPLVTLGTHPTGAVRVALIVAAFAGLTVQGIGLVPGEVVIGEDGVFVRSLWKRTFIPRRALATIDYTSGKRLRIVEKGGAAHEILLLRESGVGPMRGALAQLMENASSAPARATSTTHEALASRALAWANEGTARGPESAYRSDEPEEHLWEIAEDVDAQPLARAGAVLALQPKDDAARARAKTVADSAAHPVVAGAFDAAARGDLEALRLAIATGLRAPTPASAVVTASGPNEEATGERGVVRPPRALHALAWLTHLWPLLPVLALALRSLPLGIAAGVMGLVGAMPWTAVREYDPLTSFTPGAVTHENGLLVQDGQRLLALADVKRAYVHRRPGHPAVVRFEGRGGWVLLDVRAGGPRATRAFLEHLPLRDDQRTVSFSTMQTSKAFERGMIAFITAAMAGLALAKAFLPGYAIATFIGLGMTLVRLPRYVTPERDGIAIRQITGTRFVRYADVVAVERRKGAGVVVTESGERIRLRSVEGDLTSAPDDDLTEMVIDRWSDWRAGQARARQVRVAAQGSEERRRSEGEAESEEEKREKEVESAEEKKREEAERKREEEAREEEEEEEEEEKEMKRRIS